MLEKSHMPINGYACNALLNTVHNQQHREERLHCLQDLLANVAPKKPNWDLRRDVEKRLGKLERRTQRALVQLAQEQQTQSVEAQ